jgi:hypothetical protein
MCLNCAGKAYQQESLCLNREVCTPGHEMSKHITVMCCGSAKTLKTGSASILF